jgi:hypothetical protein
LPTSEKVVGDGSFIETGRFYFTSSNPTVSSAIPGFTTTVMGENWLMELDYLTGGAKNSPFLDLSGNQIIDDDDRVKKVVAPSTTLAPDLSTDGIAVGKWVSIGVLSQPILVQLSTLNNTLFNQNPDVTLVPVVLGSGAGVTGGHFDVDVFYANSTGGARATATITVGTSGQTSGFPATLGDITVDGVTVVSALTVNDLADGFSSNTNASVIASQVTGGFTATRARNSNVITITAPVGAQFNGKKMSVAAGTSQALVDAVAGVAAQPAVAAVTAVPPTGFIVFNGTSNRNYRINNDLINNQSIQVNGRNVWGSSITPNGTSATTASQAAAAVVNAIGTAGTYKAYIGGNSITPLCAAQSTNGKVVCIIDTSTINYGNNNGQQIAVGSVSNGGGLSFTTTNTAGGVTGVTAVAAVPAVTAVPRSGWTNFAPALTVTAFSGGAEASSVGDTCVDTACKYRTHFHQYDKVFDVTGVNMLNPSSTTLNIKLGIPSLSQNFKVIVQNQYLSPAVKLHIGDPNYLYYVDFGYISLQDYTTSATLDLATLQTYRRDPNAAWSGSTPPTAAQLALPKPIGSFVFNMPLDALTSKDWSGEGDVRAGLHPTIYRCVWQADSNHDGNMYQPVIPPANGATGPGVAGWSNSTSPTTATGARHNGALVLQLIRDTTPNSALEQNVAGRPEYGWRVKSALYSQYVLMEYATYWHHPNGKCYSDSGWTKTPPADNGTTTPIAKAPGSTDPHIGNLSAGSAGTGNGTVTSVKTTIAGQVTTSVVTYVDGTHATIVRTANSDGSVTIVTTDATGAITTQKVMNLDGSLKTGGDELGRVRAISGRISWRELVAP